ncbi:MAG: prepilin-type N-terminal cleavage/methylation domain-containing protein [Candidatus Coatesbacteria bacterium]|nr:prepilin-type N-terminal cleavage/methylation domain-containing protein [Candidatus Coatesbacteria bacterium]
MIRPLVLLRTTCNRGFTIIEMVVVVAIIALLAGIITPLVFNLLDEGNETATREEMANIRTAITNYYTDVNMWPPTWVTDGSGEKFSGLKMLAATKTSRGYLLPCDESGKPFGYAEPIPGYDAATRMGWHGPYIADSDDDTGFYRDAWDVEYAYVSYPEYYAVYIDPTSDNPQFGLETSGYLAVPVEAARVFLASKGPDMRHTDVPPSSTPKMKSEDEMYPENLDDIKIKIAGTDWGMSYWLPLAAAEGYK